MMASCARRMAARIASEDQMAAMGSAADGEAGADPEQHEEAEFAPVREVDQEEEEQQQQQVALEAAGAGEPQNSPSGAVGP